MKENAYLWEKCMQTYTNCLLLNKLMRDWLLRLDDKIDAQTFNMMAFGIVHLIETIGISIDAILQVLQMNRNYFCAQIFSVLSLVLTH
jgi:hypothetical protein